MPPINRHIQHRYPYGVGTYKKPIRTVKSGTRLKANSRALLYYQRGKTPNQRSRSKTKADNKSMGRSQISNMYNKTKSPLRSPPKNNKNSSNQISSRMSCK